MKMTIKTKRRQIEIVFILSLFILSHFQTVNSLEPFSHFSFEYNYDILREYDFFVPEVDVVCQCSCTNERRESCRPIDGECALLINSTTTCTNHITVNTDSSICSKFYKLCCQVYFTKAKMMKTFKAVKIEYHETLLTLKEYNITITEHVKNLILFDDKVIQVHQFVPVHHIPEGWYFIENGCNELYYADSINAIDELNMNNIGWFQINNKKKGLSRVSTWELEKCLHVKLLDCHSNPPKFEWKLDATNYVSKGLLHLPKNIEKVSEKYKDMAKISIDIKEEKIKIEPVNPSSVNITLADVRSLPFMFTSTIKETELHLTITKGNGTFLVKITSSYWTEEYSYSISSSANIIHLPSLNYDSCWICVYQHNQQLCQIPSSSKFYKHPIPSPTVSSNNKSQINPISDKELRNESDFRRNSGSIIPKSIFNIIAMIATVIVLSSTCLCY